MTYPPPAKLCGALWWECGVPRLIYRQSFYYRDPYPPVQRILVHSQALSFKTRVNSFYTPLHPGIMAERHWFGHDFTAYDWTNGGLLDFIYTGTMRLENVEITAEDTGGACGGDSCVGAMLGPTLFAQEFDGSFSEQSHLMRDF